MKLSVKNVEISSINPSAYNPRDITPEAFEGLKASLKKFGMVDPLVVNTRTGNLVGGHQRLKAAQALEWKSVPVVEVDLSETEEKALNVTLNNPRIAGHFTSELQALLTEIKTDFTDIEFDELKLDELVIPDSWDDTEEVDDQEENLDGIKATIKVKCPQDIKDEVLILIKRAILETSLEGVEVV